MKLSKKAATNLIALVYGKGMPVEEALDHEGLKDVTEEELRETVATLYKVVARKETAAQSKARSIAEGIAANVGVGNTFQSDVITATAEKASIKPASVIGAGKRAGLWERIPSMGKALYKVLATAQPYPVHTHIIIPLSSHAPERYFYANFLFLFMQVNGLL